MEVPGTVPAYIVVQIAIHDSAQYAHYMALAPASIAAYSGRYIVRGGSSEVLEGSWQPARLPYGSSAPTRRCC